MSEPPVHPDLEALLLLVTEPITAAELSEVVGREEQVVVAELRALADHYDRTGRGFQLRQVAGGWQYATRASEADLIARWVVSGQRNRLSQAALETLAVIAYLQPVPRSRVSAVRGVNVDGVVRTLISRGLVAEADSQGATGAGLLTTTALFLERLGISSLDDLPPMAPLLPEAQDLAAELAQLAIIPDQVEDTDE